MLFHILTLFPGMFQGPLSESILERAQSAGLLTVHLVNFREFATDRHKTVDDYPYGGGAGMVLKPEPLFAAVEAVQADIRQRRGEAGVQDTPVILLTPAGRLFTQQEAQRLAQKEEVILICGHYEGVDERVAEHLATDQLSIGDFILTGGELPALCIVDAVARLLPGVLHSPLSPAEESFTNGLLEYPHYTRPPEFRGWKVPEVLLSGNHQAIARWRREQSLLRTLQRRPDLLAKATLTEDDKRFLEEARRRLGLG
ncbi:MAG: tRNA (guanosine(37)-N1)-methyltransferase TrmD [Dehalococcoidia bacterium]|nr:tRNA (guanosine(37)-N1)-methyltransferase TrmD [Dehalococcoidia bacterium]MDW8119779.1 tRNA (guanosine(37)-N1)-methyltransferase TrmD [Chloroflexota bacterium]